MDIYDLINELNSIKEEHYWDNLPYSFNQSNRARLKDEFDIEVFDLAKKAYEITILYTSDRNGQDPKSEYRKYGDEGIVPFTDSELELLDDLDWSRLPHNFKAHIFDTIWLCNRRYEAAETAAEEYYVLYRECFDEVNWVQCVDYIGRAIELVAQIRFTDKKEAYLAEVYNDIVRLNGDDPSFLSVSLIELIIDQNYCCDFNTLITLLDRVILKNEKSIRTAHIAEQAYYAKADLYRKLKDYQAENNAYVQYADSLMMEVERLLKASNEGNAINYRNCFRAENDIKKAIELFQNHGASEKAVDAQKRLIEIQKTVIKHMPMHEVKFDVSEVYKKFRAEYENHNIHELIWDVIFAFGFQNKQQICEDVKKDSSRIVSLFPMQIIGSEGQTEFSLPSLNLDDENNILLHMYYKAREYETIQGQTVGVWFIRFFRKQDLQLEDLNFIFENNPIIPKGQEKDVQRGVYYGLTGHMSDALDKLAPKMENIIRYIADMCGDLMMYFDSKEGAQKSKVLSQVFLGENLNECVEENILFTFDGLLQQQAGSNIRNRIGHGLNTEAEYSTGDCIYFVMIVLKFCALFCESFGDEIEKHRRDRTM